MLNLSFTNYAINICRIPPIHHVAFVTVAHVGQIIRCEVTVSLDCFQVQIIDREGITNTGNETKSIQRTKPMIVGATWFVVYSRINNIIILFCGSHCLKWTENLCNWRCFVTEVMKEPRVTAILLMESCSGVGLQCGAVLSSRGSDGGCQSACVKLCCAWSVTAQKRR